MSHLIFSFLLMKQHNVTVFFYLGKYVKLLAAQQKD